jgi:hypothetical protein
MRYRSDYSSQFYLFPSRVGCSTMEEAVVEFTRLRDRLVMHNAQLFCVAAGLSNVSMLESVVADMKRAVAINDDANIELMSFGDRLRVEQWRDS